VCCSVLQCVAVCCSVLQCVAVCCSVLQCVAVCCGSRMFSNRGQQNELIKIKYEGYMVGDLSTILKINKCNICD